MPGLRAEAELSYAKYAIGSYDSSFTVRENGVVVFSDSNSYPAPDDAEIGVTYLMGNVWYNIPAMSGGMAMTPYVGGGLGIALVTDETGQGGGFDDTNGIAYQVGAGVQFPVGAGAIDVGYRYMAVTGISLEGDFIPPDVDIDDADLASNHF